MEPDFVRIANDIVGGILTDMAAMGAASFLEDEIERRGTEAIGRYMDALWDLPEVHLGVHRPIAGERYEWVFIRATPALRAQAFLKAIA